MLVEHLLLHQMFYSHFAFRRPSANNVLHREAYTQQYSKPSLAPRKGGYAVPLLHTALLTQKHPLLYYQLRTILKFQVSGELDLFDLSNQCIDVFWQHQYPVT